MAVQQWTIEQANAWATSSPGCWVSTICPHRGQLTEMWQAETFDPATIDQGWAGPASWATTPCTNLPFIVWQYDRDGLIARIEQFLGLCRTASA